MSNNKGEKKRKFGEWFFKRQKKEVEKLIDKIDIRAEDIMVVPPEENVVENYAKQMQEGHAFMIDKNFWMVVRPKPWWMPSFLYKAIIKNLVEFNQYK